MKEHLKKLARSGRSRVIGWSGRTGLSQRAGQSRWRSRRLLILCYHGISIRDEHQWLDQLFVTQDFLRRRFEVIRDSGCHVLPLDDAIQRLNAGTLPERSVVITFDDGFYNYFRKGVPLLEEFGFPATNYVSTYYVLNQRPLLNLAISYVLWRCKDRVLSPGTLDGQEDIEVNLASLTERSALQDRLLRHAERLSRDKARQAAWLAEFAGRVEMDWQDILDSRILHLMNEQEIATAAKRGTDIQLHTHRHRTPVDEALFVDEITENKDIIQSLTGQYASHFCYPSGHVVAEFLPWLRKLGIDSATTGYSSLARRQDDALLLPRFVDTMHQTEEVFEAWLHGVPDILRPRRARQ